MGTFGNTFGESLGTQGSKLNQILNCIFTEDGLNFIITEDEQFYLIPED